MPSTSAVPKTPKATNYDEMLRRFVAESGIPCLGHHDKNSDTHIHLYVANSIFSTECNQRILNGLYEFIAESDLRDGRETKKPFRSFALVFEDAIGMSEEEFELSLWTRLQSLHDDDSYAWETGVIEDKDDHAFRFSAGNHSFRIACLHPSAKSKERKCPIPVVFMGFENQVKDLKKPKTSSKGLRGVENGKSRSHRPAANRRLKLYEIAY